MSGLIPQPFIDEVLQRTDIVELIDGYVPLKKRGNSHLACCPFHNEKSPSFNVHAKKQFYHCFGCGESGNAISFLMQYLNQGFVEAIETLATRLGLSIPRDGQDKKQQTQTLYQLLDKVSHYYQKTLKNQAPEAIQYLQQRGLNGETAALYQLGYAPQGWHTLESVFRQHQVELVTTGMLIKKDDGKTYDRYRHRIMFPIHDRHGRIIGFGGRALSPDQTPKYLNSPETVIFQKSRELYGLHQVLTKKNQDLSHIIVVEGYMDVIALAQHGIDNAVATLGTATSTFHIQLLAKHTQKLIFCFDGDKAGKTAAWRALESSLPHLTTGLDASFIFLPEGQDPDSFVREHGKETFLSHLTNSTPLHQFFFDTLSQGINLLTPAGKTQLIHEVKPYLANMVESSYKQILIDNLARLTHIESHRLNNLILKTELPTSQAKYATLTRTPARIAVALLLQHPEIYTDCKINIDPSLFDNAELIILKKIRDYLSLNPQANTAALIELWRNNPLFESINKLASWDHQVPEQELAKEFTDTVLFLEKQHFTKKIHQLIEKSRQEGLTNAERLVLQDMLKTRHQLIH
jgi:DNA primase